VSIGAVICAPTLRAFPLITELSNILQISDATSETRLSELEEFWNSEMARIGAEGWEKWYASGKPGISASYGVELAKPNVVQLDPYCQWSFNEIQRNHSSLLPTKSSDQVVDTDPFATVLFSDIRPSLFEMKYLAVRLAFRLA